jgi:hypothetical protein
MTELDNTLLHLNNIRRELEDLKDDLQPLSHPILTDKILELDILVADTIAVSETLKSIHF